MRNALIIILLSCSYLAFGQENSTLSGFITDGRNGETMIGAKVYIPSIHKGAVTNNYGFYSLTVPKGIYTVEFRIGGMDTECQRHSKLSSLTHHR